MNVYKIGQSDVAQDHGSITHRRKPKGLAAKLQWVLLITEVTTIKYYIVGPLMKSSSGHNFFLFIYFPSWLRALEKKSVLCWLSLHF